MHDVRPSPIAGIWYPGTAEHLRSCIEEYLQAAPTPEIQGEVLGMIVPHAGYRYSGRIAASAFKHVQGLAPNVVAVLSPLHHPHPSPLYTSGHKAYATPLGEIPIDHDLVAALREHLSQTAHLDLDEILVDEEHSLEIELPFLQYALRSQFCLLPVMLRDQSAATAQALGRTLGLLLRDRAALLVASSDLSHFQTESVARRLDEYVLQRIEAFDPLGVLSAEELGRGSACGRGAIATALWAAKALGADDVSVLQYGHSGEVTGDRRHVVGYAAALITCQPRQG